MRENDVLLGPFVTNEFSDRYLHEVNRSAFNKVGSDALYAQIFGHRLFEEDTLNIVIGTDSGLLPGYVLKRGVPDGAHFLFVELPAVLERINQTEFPKSNDKRINFTTYEDWRKTLTRSFCTNRLVP